MSKKKNALSMIQTFLCLIIMLSVSNPVTAFSAITDQPPGIEVRAAATEWRYKFENGLIYRRLYDYTNQRWIGDWELCP